MSGHATAQPVSPRRVGWLSLYAVAMGWLEAAVVVYLRELYYPDGFRFPLVILSERILIVELVRELTTLVMVLAIAMLAGSGRTDRFFVFGFVFGVWDIVYYVGLWVFLGWPPSLLTWDVLFLIPVPWLGPVAFPVLVSLLLIGGFLVHDWLRKRGRSMRLTGVEWAVASAGAVVVIVAFCWNWRLIAQGATPATFPVKIFTVGLFAGVVPFFRAGLRALGEKVPAS
jgi:hypothetical protein